MSGAGCANDEPGGTDQQPWLGGAARAQTPARPSPGPRPGWHPGRDLDGRAGSGVWLSLHRPQAARVGRTAADPPAGGRGRVVLRARPRHRDRRRLRPGQVEDRRRGPDRWAAGLGDRPRVDVPHGPPRAADEGADVPRGLVRRRPGCLRGRPGRDRRALRHGAGRPRVHHFRAQPERHRTTGRERGGPLGRPSPCERAAARWRRRPGSVRRPHRLGDPAQHGHPHRTNGDVQPAAQHDERPVPRGQPAPRHLPRRLRRRRRPGQLDAQRVVRPGSGPPPRHPRPQRQRGRGRRQAGRVRKPRASPSTTTCWSTWPGSRRSWTPWAG